MKRRTFGLGLLGAAGAATVGGVYAFWEDEPAGPPISLSVEQNHSLVPADASSDVWALIRVGAEEPDCDDRPPISVGLVIDTSGSMEGAPIEAARQAAADLIETLRDGDRLTIVTFDSRAALIAEPTLIDSGSRDDILEKVSAIAARGTTDLAAGLRLALNEVNRFVEPGTVTRIVLLSDGVPNSAAEIPSIAAQLASSSITVTALGLGLDYDETLLGSIAQQTGGSFHYVEDASEIAPMFTEENARLQGVVANSIGLNLMTGPNVQITEVAGSPIGAPTDSLSLGLGDLSRGEERVVGIRLSVGPHRDGAAVELLDVSVSYVDPALNVAASLQPVFVSARATKDREALAVAVVPEVETEVEQLQAAASMLEALALARQGDNAKATEILRGAAPRAIAAAKNLESIQLSEQAGELEALAEDLAESPQAAAAEPDQATAGKRRETRDRANRFHGSAMSNFQPRKKR